MICRIFVKVFENFVQKKVQTKMEKSVVKGKGLSLLIPKF